MAPVLRSATSCELGGPSTPHAKEARSRLPPLLQLPLELLERVALDGMPASTLCALASTCTQFRAAAEACDLWRAEWRRVYGDVGAVQEGAAVRAGGWKALFAARHAALKEAEPWQKPCEFEVQSSVDMLAALPPRRAPSSECVGEEAGEEAGEGGAGEEQQAPELCVLFLVDGSGSVTEEDFRVMTGFMAGAVRGLAAAGGGRRQVAVVQFSNDVRVEQAPADVDVAGFEALLGGMARMNGGTNIALAVQRAGQLLKPLPPTTHRVLVLLTDGRIDSHQSREARDMAARLADEQAHVRLHAYGVGRGVDKQELLRICAARDPDTAEDRYLGLMVLDEAPW